MSDAIRDNFLTDIIDADLQSRRHQNVVTRFPPEPNGYPHIGHAKSICLNWGLAQRYGGRFHLRYDDTNPVAEEEEFVDAIARDVCWLIGADRLEHVYWASDYFERMYGFACELIDKGLAYVDSQSPEQVRVGRGDFNTPGTPSPFRDRTVAENRDLFARMRAGEFAEGEHILRARIDMASPNVIMRDPLLYRIKHARHHNTGDAWCIYPMYDFAHCLEDAIEHITHSICTLEFENNRELYDWIIENVSVPSRPRQYEFARLNLDYTVVSKRKLKRLVEQRHVDGWDDPRMPTIAGLRRRGVRAQAIRAFCDLVGVARTNSTVDIGKLDFAIRDDLNTVAPRVMAVLDPIPFVITNLPPDHHETLSAPLWPDEFKRDARRDVTFSSTVLIDRDDFALHPPPGYKRLSVGRSVRLRYGRAVVCDEAVLGADGTVAELRGRVTDAPSAAVIHWVDAATAVPAQVRLYDRLFAVPAPGDDPDVDFLDELNPTSLTVHGDARIEAYLAHAALAALATRDADPGLHVQFERLGYFVPDVSATADRLVFNRVVALKDGWAKQNAAPDTGPRAAGDRAPQTQPRHEDVASARGADVRERFDGLVRAGVQPELALPIATREDFTAFVRSVAVFSRHANDAAKAFLNLTAPAWEAAAPYEPAALGRLLADLADGRVSAADARRAHAQLVATGAYDPSDATAVDDGQLRAWVDEVVAANGDAVDRYRAGKTQLLAFFTGQVMRRAGGAADADAVKAALVAALG